MKKVLLSLVGVAVILLGGCSAEKGEEEVIGYVDTDRYEGEIEAFEAADAVAMPAAGAVVFAGSSSFRMWHPWLAEDLAPLPVIGRGFGGSNMNDLENYAERIVFKYRPRAIAVYEGDNDLNAGIPVALFVERFAGFVKRAQEAVPGVRIYFVSIKPSEQRWAIWPKMQEANARIAALCAKEEGLFYVDMASVLLGADGKPDASLFLEDKLHLNREGYLRWREVARKEIVERELGME